MFTSELYLFSKICQNPSFPLKQIFHSSIANKLSVPLMKSNLSMPTTLPWHLGMEPKFVSLKDPINPLHFSTSSSELSKPSVQSNSFNNRSKKSGRKKSEGFIITHRLFWRTVETLSLLETANSSQSAVRKILSSFG